MNNNQFINFVINVINQDLTPILQMVTTISFFIGLCMILAGLTRLYRHGQMQSMFYRVSPMGTAMYLLSGVVLIGFIPNLELLSTSLFNANSVLIQQCKTGGGYIPPVSPSGFYTSGNNFCPLEAYSTDITNAPPGEVTKEAIKYLVFAVVVLVGIISFIRGMIQLVRIGEGHGQGTVGKALTHIFAGIVAVNIDTVYAIFQNVLAANVPPS